MAWHTSSSTETGIFLIGLIIVGGIGIVGWVLPANPKLGTWFNFPSQSTCPYAPQVSIVIPDQCEFMANNKFRSVLINPGTPFLTQLTTHCNNPSNTLNSFLALQVANYSFTTGTNSSLFIDAFGGHQVAYLDNHLGHPNGNGKCPGDISAGTFSPISAGQPPNGGWVFRVVGSGGGGQGDNPSFTSVRVELSTQSNRLIQVTPLSITTNGFTAFAYIQFSPATTTTINFDWIATNSTLEQHASGSCTVTTFGLPRCSSIVTFTIPFLAPPDIVMTSKTGAILVSIVSGFVELFDVQPT